MYRHGSGDAVPFVEAMRPSRVHVEYPRCAPRVAADHAPVVVPGIAPVAEARGGSSRVQPAPGALGRDPIFSEG